MMIKFICLEPMIWKGNALGYMSEGICTQDEFVMLSAAGKVAFKSRIIEMKIENQMMNLDNHIEKRTSRMNKRIK